MYKIEHKFIAEYYVNVIIMLTLFKKQDKGKTG